MIKIGDKIKYVKNDWGIDLPIGTVLEVKGIQKTNILASANYKVHNCVVAEIQCIVSYDEIQKYFEKVIDTKEEKQKSKRVWTDWKEFELCDLKGFDCEYCHYRLLCNTDTMFEYKTNYKKTIVKCKIGNEILKAESTCHKNDTFNINKGLEIALKRLAVKIAKYELEKTIKEIG